MVSLVRDLAIGAVLIALVVASPAVAVDIGESGVDVSLNTSAVGASIDNAVRSLGESARLDQGAAEDAIQQRVNEERVDRGRDQVVWSDQLAVAARDHAEDMASSGYYGHQAPDGSPPESRYPACYGGETLLRWAEAPADADLLADAAIESWIESTEHRQIILERGQRSVGVGVAVAEDGTAYVAMAFCD